MSLGPLMIHETLVDDELAGTPSITKGIWRAMGTNRPDLDGFPIGRQRWRPMVHAARTVIWVSVCTSGGARTHHEVI